MICKEVRLLYYCVKRKCGKVCEALPYVGLLCIGGIVVPHVTEESGSTKFPKPLQHPQGGMRQRLGYGSVTFASLFHEVEDMPHALFFRAHVILVVFVGLDFYWHNLRYFEAVGLQADAFDGVVCHEPHAMDTQLLKY